MKYDVFLSICQNEVDGKIPNEDTMFGNFFSQVELADELGFETAWIAETHLSCETQKKGKNPVIPHFKGEIGLNTDILQMTLVVFSRTKNINVGSAIRNILCNGGPIAHAEGLKTFLNLLKHTPYKNRTLSYGFASGRFEFSNRPYGIVPRNKVEEAAWPVVKGKILQEATEIFLRLLRGEEISHKEISPKVLTENSFRTPEDWQKVAAAHKELTGEVIKEIRLKPQWPFEKLKVIPQEVDLSQLNLVIGSHDPNTQDLANKFLPVSVFNLSITPPAVIDATHERMREKFHKDGGPWKRENMPRTALVYVDNTPGLTPEQQTAKAKEKARDAWAAYLTAIQGTLDKEKVEKAVSNTLAGNPKDLAEQIKSKYHKEDRLMLWFDFNNHDNEDVCNSMKVFKNEVIPLIEKG